MLSIDLTMSNPNKHRVICTDFGATLDLGAVEKGNCSVDNHSVTCIFFVVSNWREVEYVNIKGNADKTITNDCDKWIFFGDTISKGKKNDHVFHNTCLDYVVDYYDGERERAGCEKIPMNILHTDNCAGQYKCRQNFLKLTTFTDRHPGTYAQHKFAQKFKFKGPWDATGKIVKEAIENCELQYKRCANAIDCYNYLRPCHTLELSH